MYKGNLATCEASKVDLNFFNHFADNLQLQYNVVKLL